jgi:hypothetical protein
MIHLRARGGWISARSGRPVDGYNYETVYKRHLTSDLLTCSPPGAEAPFPPKEGAAPAADTMPAADLLGRSVSNLVHHRVRETVRRSAERRSGTTSLDAGPHCAKPRHHAQDRRHLEVDLCRRAHPRRPPVAFSISRRREKGIARRRGRQAPRESIARVDAPGPSIGIGRFPVRPHRRTSRRGVDARIVSGASGRPRALDVFALRRPFVKSVHA